MKAEDRKTKIGLAENYLVLRTLEFTQTFKFQKFIQKLTHMQRL